MSYKSRRIKSSYKIRLKIRLKIRRIKVVLSRIKIRRIKSSYKSHLKIHLSITSDITLVIKITHKEIINNS